jgi:hypothetical protein
MKTTEYIVTVGTHQEAMGRAAVARFVRKARHTGGGACRTENGGILVHMLLVSNVRRFVWYRFSPVLEGAMA